MSQLRILCVGRKAKDPLLESANHYLARLQKMAKAQLVRLKDSSVEAEGTALLARLQPSEVVVALDEKGEAWTTTQLARFIQATQQGGQKVAFIVGGADGLSDGVKRRAQHIVALSAMTLPHRMALALILEQLYRAHCILRGSAYHRP